MLRVAALILVISLFFAIEFSYYLTLWNTLTLGQPLVPDTRYQSAQVRMNVERL